MKYRKPKKKKGSDTPKWLSTYADMITLVLVFFILLFSISQIDAEKFKTVAESYRNRAILEFNPSIVPADHPSDLGDEVDTPDDLKDIPNSQADEEENEDEIDQETEQGQNDEEELSNEDDSLADLMNEVNSFLTNEGLEDVITANRTERGIVLTLQEKILFESGEAELIEDGKPFLNKVGKLLDRIPNHVNVEGHTDSRPISTYRYPSNWELSGARASSVIRYLLEQYDLEDSRFQSSGLADTRPVAKNDSPENWQKNRRVEIIILEHDN
jgi:chemotaxis protein MotB